MFISSDCAELESNRLRYNPSGLLSLLWSLPGIPPTTLMFVLWIQYKALSNVIVDRYGNFDLNSTMTALRDHYNGFTDFWMFLAMKMNYWSPMFQYIACLGTGEFVISRINPCFTLGLC